MSDIGRSVESLLPEDIETRLANVQENISNLERRIIDLNKEVEEKLIEKNIVENQLGTAKNELEKATASFEIISLELNEREKIVAQKESTLNIYANALEEKEKKINKYLAIFENMKDIRI